MPYNPLLGRAPTPEEEARSAQLQRTLFSNNPLHFDDWLDSFYLQATSQIDGLRHIGYPGLGFYGGHRADEFA